MSTSTSMTGASETVPTIAEPPPIVMLLPLLQHLLSWSSLFIRLGFHLFLAALYPLRAAWFILDALLSPVIIAAKITFDIMLFTPFSIIRIVAAALYPVYIFCAVACITGATVGIFGYHISTTVMRSLSQSRYFARPSTPPPAPPPSISRGVLRKGKRKSVRLQ